MKPSQSSKFPRASKRPANQQHSPDAGSRYAVDYMDHAPVWQGPIFAPGLFRPTQNGAPAQPLEVHFNSKVMDMPMCYVLHSPEVLNITDQVVYFHLCQRVAAGDFVRLDTEHGRFAAYRDALGVTGLWAEKPMAVVKLKLSDLAAGIGLTRTGTNARAVLASLSRLSQVTMQQQVVSDKGVVVDQGTSRFLAFLCSDTDVRIVLNFESNLLARQHKGVAWVDMREHRSLDSKPAKRLHAWLSAWASTESRKLVGLDSLVINVWGEEPATRDIRKDRKRTLRKAIKEVGQLPGWSCVYTEKGDQLLVVKPGFVGTKGQKAKLKFAVDAEAVPAATTPTKPVVTPTEAAVTPTEIVATPTGVVLQSAPSLDSDELVFSL